MHCYSQLLCSLSQSNFLEKAVCHHFHLLTPIRSWNASFLAFYFCFHTAKFNQSRVCSCWVVSLSSIQHSWPFSSAWNTSLFWNRIPYLFFLLPFILFDFPLFTSSLILLEEFFVGSSFSAWPIRVECFQKCFSTRSLQVTPPIPWWSTWSTYLWFSTSASPLNFKTWLPNCQVNLFT